MELYENERIDYVNDKLSLIQKTDGLTFGTDALLLAGYIAGGYRVGVELGGGTGIISMLLRTREKVGRAYAVEVQEEYAELIKRNTEFNGITELIPVQADVREYRCPLECDLVYTNPPYMKVTSGYSNREDKKNVARHEVMGDITDFMQAAKRLLKWGGDLAVVYRPDRLVDLVTAMRNSGIEPKVITLVMADTEAAPSLALVLGRRGGKPGVRMTPPLLLYSDISHKTNSADMEYILENGIFPDKYYVNQKVK